MAQQRAATPGHGRVDPHGGGLATFAQMKVAIETLTATLDTSIASSAIWKQRGPLMRQRAWLPAPGPIATLHAILLQIEEFATSTGVSTPVFSSAKAVFDKALADGRGELDIASVHDLISGDSADGSPQ
jgi:3-hydroxyisobutyrate dehydrogenase